jgi:N-acetyl-anhydromuramyl-L-alanine amidase AmpD
VPTNEENKTDTESTERNDDELKIDTSRQSPNWSSRQQMDPDVIVLHVLEGYYDSGIDHLCRKATQAATHFVVGKDGRVAQLVGLRRAAWGNGTDYENPKSNKYNGKSKKKLINSRKANANWFSISIEFEGFYAKDKGLTEKQHKKAVKLLLHIRKRIKKLYGYYIPLDREHVMAHCEIVPIHKPYCGKNIDIDRILKDANALI